MYEKVFAYLDAHAKDYAAQLCRWVEVPSVKGEATPGAPFGKDVRRMLEAGADALIVQDLGAARAIREHFPSAVLHASTQLTVHSLEGARFAAEQGFSRVVLSR